MQNEKFVVALMEGRKGKLPQRAHAIDAGIDFFAPEDMEPATLKPGQHYLVNTGVRVGVPEGWALIGFNKSGVAVKKRLVLGACTVDAGYSGELFIHVNNIGDSDTVINPGEKIAQFILLPVGLHEVTQISEKEYFETRNSERGEGCLGSTGTK